MDNLSKPTAKPRTILRAPAAPTLLAGPKVAHQGSGFLSLVGHEIHAPLEGMLETVALLLETDLSKEQRRHAEKVQKSGKALLTTINDILDLSKIEAGELRLEAIEFDLHATVAEVAESFRNSAHAGDSEMTFLIHQDVPAMVRGDPGRLRQILTYFLPYALQFTGEKRITLRAQVMEGAEDEVRVRFEVTQDDQGVLIEWPESVAQSPPQEKMEYARKPPGTGLGFAIAKRLAELMGGRFGVESKPGKRSVVWFSVRLGKPSKQALESPTPRADLRGLSALAVMDNQATHNDLLARTLSWGMSCDIALDATQALEMLRARASRGQSYDLAILDMQIPGSDGLELARAIQMDPGLSAVHPVILIAVGLRGHAEESRQAGIAGYLTKPVDQSELYNCLTTVMGVQDNSSAAQTRATAPLVTSHSLKEAKSRRSKRVLVAEDNIVNQMVAVRMLEKLGAQVDVAGNGLAAVEACQRTQYDLVLMDCQMPELDGFAATRQILDSEPDRGDTHTPIVAVTANAMKEDREKCLAAGMDDYISKPFALAQIRKLLERWVPESPASNSTPETSAGLVQHAALDPGALQGLWVREGDGAPNFLTQLIAQYLREARGRLTAIKEAAEHGDASALILAAHSLRGSSAVMGAKGMAGLCSGLEGHAQRGEMNEAVALAGQLENEFGRVREELQAQSFR